MKVTGAAFCRLAALALLLIGSVRRGEARAVSQVLGNPDTYQAARAVAQDARRLETEEDTKVKLIPRIDEDWLSDPMQRCCLRATILDSYLKIFNPLKDWHHSARMLQLYVDLARLSQDLKKAQCNVTDDQRERHVQRFHETLNQMTQEHRFIKALSEVDLLFMDLQDHCVPESADR